MDCDYYKWSVLKLFVTIYDHSWLTDNDDHLFGKSFFSNNSLHFPQMVVDFNIGEKIADFS